MTRFSESNIEARSAALARSGRHGSQKKRPSKYSMPSKELPMTASSSHIPTTRRPGESRDPPFNVAGVDKWVPAFAGTTAEGGVREFRIIGPALSFRVGLLRGGRIGKGRHRHAALIDPHDPRILRDIGVERLG